MHISYTHTLIHILCIHRLNGGCIILPVLHIYICIIWQWDYRLVYPLAAAPASAVATAADASQLLVQPRHSKMQTRKHATVNSSRWMSLNLSGWQGRKLQSLTRGKHRFVCATHFNTCETNWPTLHDSCRHELQTEAIMLQSSWVICSVTFSSSCQVIWRISLSCSFFFLGEFILFIFFLCRSGVRAEASYCWWANAYTQTQSRCLSTACSAESTDIFKLHLSDVFFWPSKTESLIVI